MGTVEEGTHGPEHDIATLVNRDRTLASTRPLDGQVGLWDIKGGGKRFDAGSVHLIHHMGGTCRNLETAHEEIENLKAQLATQETADPPRPTYAGLHSVDLSTTGLPMLGCCQGMLLCVIFVCVILVWQCWSAKFGLPSVGLPNFTLFWGLGLVGFRVRVRVRV